MAMKNRELLLALKNTTALRAAVSKTDRDRALEAILLADASSQASFEDAVIAHRAFWGTIDNPNLGAMIKRPSVVGRGYQYLELAPGTTDTFVSMKQAAAEQRVKFALAGAPTDALVGLLTTDYADNGKQLRDYLESKQNSFGLTLNTIPGWTPTANEDVLTKDSLLQVRAEAANQLLIQLMAKPGLTDPKLFNDLITATNIADFQTAAKALATAGGLTLPPGKTLDDVTNALKFDSIAGVVAEARARHTVLLDDQAIKGFEKQLQEFRTSVTNTDLLTMGAILGNATTRTALTQLAAHANLKEDPDNPYKARMAGLPDGKKDALVTSHLGALCEQYLQAKIAATNKPVNNADLVNALKEANTATLRGQIQGFIAGTADDNRIVDRAVTDANVTTFKMALAKNVIGKLGATVPGFTDAQMKKLQEASANLSTFKAAMEDHVGDATHTAFNFLKAEHLPELRQAIREQVEERMRNTRAATFDAAVANSRLGAAAHAQLKAVFKQLPSEKQAELVKTKPDGTLEADSKKIEVLIKAKTLGELQFHLGAANNKGGALILTGLVEENERAALWKQIHNPTIAKLLAGTNIVPTPAMITNINTTLQTHRALDISTQANFKTVIDAVRGHCGVVPNSDPFYQLFGFNDHNAAGFNDGGAKATAAQGEHLANKALFDALAYVTPPPAPPAIVLQQLTDQEKAFVDILLRAGVSIPNIRATSAADAVTDIRKAHNLLRSTTDVHQFLDKLIPNPAAHPGVKEKLSREFTPDEFRSLRGATISHNMANADAEGQLKQVKGIGTRLEEFQVNTADIEKNKKDLASIPEEIESIVALYNAANDAKANNAADKMIGKYKELSKQSATTIEHLESAKLELELRLASTPIAAGKNPEVKAKIKELHVKIEAELDKIDEQLAFYTDLKEKLDGNDGAIAKIERVKSGVATVVVESDTVQYSVVKKGEEGKDKNAIQTKGGTASVTGGVVGANPTPHFKLEIIPDAGSVIAVDITHHKDNPRRGLPVAPGQPPEPDFIKTSEARVTLDYHPPGSSKSDKALGVYLPVVATDKNYLAEQCMEAAKNLLKKLGWQRPY